MRVDGCVRPVRFLFNYAFRRARVENDEIGPRAPNKTSWEPMNNEQKTDFLGSLAESALAEEKTVFTKTWFC